MRIAGILHDVGKLGVPTRLLRKDGPLTPDERRIVELHPEYGHEMVRGIGFLGRPGPRSCTTTSGSTAPATRTG